MQIFLLNSNNFIYEIKFTLSAGVALNEKTCFALFFYSSHRNATMLVLALLAVGNDGHQVLKPPGGWRLRSSLASRCRAVELTGGRLLVACPTCHSPIRRSTNPLASRKPFSSPRPFRSASASPLASQTIQTRPPPF